MKKYIVALVCLTANLSLAGAVQIYPAGGYIGASSGCTKTVDTSGTSPIPYMACSTAENFAAQKGYPPDATGNSFTCTVWWHTSVTSGNGCHRICAGVATAGTVMTTFNDATTCTAYVSTAADGTANKIVSTALSAITPRDFGAAAACTSTACLNKATYWRIERQADASCSSAIAADSLIDYVDCQY